MTADERAPGLDDVVIACSGPWDLGPGLPSAAREAHLGEKADPGKPQGKRARPWAIGGPSR